MLGIIIAIIIFGVIIIIHEGGHFFAAKKCGIKVNEFSIGMGPKIFGWGKGETKYSLRLLPFGGFCAMEGENSDSSDNRSFGSKSVWKRIVVVSAGAIMNILLGFVLLIIISSAMYPAIPSLVVDEFHTSETGEITSSSCESGLKKGDKIISIDGSHMFTTTDFAYKLQTTYSNTYTVEVKRDGKKITLENVVFYDSVNKSKADFYVKPISKNPLTIVSYSAKETCADAKLIWSSLIDLLRGKYGINDMSGPVGVVSEIGKAASTGTTIAQRLESVLSLTVFITINIGIFNLLPIPALDGGRLVFLIIEAIRKKPVPAKYEAAIHAAGMMLLLLLIIFITFNDVHRLFWKNKKSIFDFIIFRW